jgi:hypothetical protein
MSQMKNNSNQPNISYIGITEYERWKQVLDALNVVVTLDKVNPKPLQRTGRDMRKALIDLFTAISEYDVVRENLK